MGRHTPHRRFRHRRRPVNIGILENARILSLSPGSPGGSASPGPLGSGFSRRVVLSLNDFRQAAETDQNHRQNGNLRQTTVGSSYFHLQQASKLPILAAKPH
jgi:hypothetical protein